MKPKFQSAYQKMYLVTPGVYEKLKNCIEENEKTVGILPSNIQNVYITRFMQFKPYFLDV